MSNWRWAVYKRAASEGYQLTNGVFSLFFDDVKQVEIESVGKMVELYLGNTKVSTFHDNWEELRKAWDKLRTSDLESVEV